MKGDDEDYNILGKYRADDTQLNVISMGTPVTLLNDDGTQKEYLLLCVIPVAMTMCGIVVNETLLEQDSYEFISAPLGDEGSYVYEEPWYGFSVNKDSVPRRRPGCGDCAGEYQRGDTGIKSCQQGTVQLYWN